MKVVNLKTVSCFLFRPFECLALLLYAFASAFHVVGRPLVGCFNNRYFIDDLKCLPTCHKCESRSKNEKLKGSTKLYGGGFVGVGRGPVVWK